MAEKNEVKMVRAIAKLSSLIHNIDYLKDNYLIPNKMRRDLSNFDNWFQEHTNVLMVELFNHKPEMLEEIIEWFNEYDTRYTVAESIEKQIVLLRSKMHSTIHGLVQIEFPKELSFPAEKYTPEQKEWADTEKALFKFANMVCSRLQTILDKGYFKRFNINEKDAYTLYVSMNELGERIVGSEKDIVAE